MSRSQKFVARKFSSFAEAERADDEYYASLRPEERMKTFFELLAVNRDYSRETAAGFPRFSRATKLARR